MTINEAIDVLENAMDFSEFDNDEIIENEEWRAQQCLITHVKNLQERNRLLGEENRRLREDIGL
jgi:hypothetical protein